MESYTFQDYEMNRNLKKKYLFKIDYFCNINVFAATFDQYVLAESVSIRKY